uniref:F-box protein AUF1-like n=1 Tax=Erigeron canadensis TaxID=72917 RepID=UPI001CB94ED5|nr:F-box protein AUF1-like [Erigeron canadensis]
MRKIKKCRVYDDSSSFRFLPDEVVLLILNKLIDFKTLCLCKLVSTRFNLIVHQVDTISFVVPPVYSFDSIPPTDVGFHKKLLQFFFKPFHLLHGVVVALSKRHVPALFFEWGFFQSAIDSMSRFRRLKSLSMELPSTKKHLINCTFLYKWKIKFSNKVESFLFLSPNSVYNTAGLSNVNEIGLEQELEDPDLHEKKFDLAFDGLLDATVRYRMLMGYIVDFPLLENVLITQSGKRGSVSCSGRNIVEMRKWLCSPADGIEHKLDDCTDFPCRLSHCYVPLLKLPFSGYLMKGVTLYLMERKDLRDGDKSFMNINMDDFEDKEEAAYGEAMMEMLKKLRSQI